MDIGKLKHRVTIQENRVTGQDPNTGRQTYEWVTVAITWAQIQGISGREFIESGGVQAAATYKIFMRYMKNIKPQYRIVNDGRLFNIKAILPDNDKTITTVMAELGVNNG